MLIYWLLMLWLLESEFQYVVPYLPPVFAVLVFIGWGTWAKVLVSLYFMAMTCNAAGLQQQAGMDVAVHLYLAVLLLCTILALSLASVFVRLRGAEGERPWEPPAAEPARESSPRRQDGGGAGDGVPLPGAVEEGKEAVRERLEAPVCVALSGRTSPSEKKFDFDSDLECANPAMKVQNLKRLVSKAFLEKNSLNNGGFGGVFA